jgi:hypothetical protein
VSYMSLANDGGRSGNGSAERCAERRSQGMAHSYPLLVRDHGLATALRLLIKTLPYALARWGVLLASAAACVVWIGIGAGGAAWLGMHVSMTFGVCWLIGVLLAGGWIWGTVLRYVFHLIACGHVAVLTELITQGHVGNGDEGQFAYGRRIVAAGFGEVAALFGLSVLIRDVLRVFHNALDTLDQWLPTPGVSTIVGLVNAVLAAATRYLDKVVLSYDLARGGPNPWRSVQDGLVYYCQNANPILKTSIWMVIVERGLSILLGLLLLVPAGLATTLLPEAMREYGALVTVLIAALLASTLRAAFIRPLFLICIMIRFHALVQNQPINANWVGYLDSLSDKFRQIGRREPWPSPSSTTSPTGGTGTAFMPNCNPAKYIHESKAGTSMQDASGYDPKYVMGRSTTETDRLRRQSQLYDASTRQLFREAGISEGMKVLDIGSGAGNVSFVAAGLVGESGQVVGVDSNPVIVEEAARIGRSLSLRQVSFRVGDINAMELERDSMRSLVGSF